MSDDTDKFRKTQERRRSLYDRASDEGMDPDIVLITDYLANMLSADEEASVERRMKDDEAFFEKVWPLIRAWQQTEDTPVSSRRVSRGVGTFTDEIRSIALSSAIRPRESLSWLGRLGQFLRHGRRSR
jgi:hypothetical protein